MNSIGKWLAVPKHRWYLYRIGVAGSVVAVAYGWVTSEQADVWLGFAGTALGFELAAQNVDKSGGKHEAE